MMCYILKLTLDITSYFFLFPISFSFLSAQTDHTPSSFLYSLHSYFQFFGSTSNVQTYSSGWYFKYADSAAPSGSYFDENEQLITQYSHSWEYLVHSTYYFPNRQNLRFVCVLRNMTYTCEYYLHSSFSFSYSTPSIPSYILNFILFPVFLTPLLSILLLDFLLSSLLLLMPVVYVYQCLWRYQATEVQGTHVAKQASPQLPVQQYDYVR